MKHILILAGLCLLQFVVAQEEVSTSIDFQTQESKKYFEEFDYSLDRKYYRFQQVIPVGSFRKVANAGVGVGFEVGQNSTFNKIKSAKYKIGVDYHIGVTFNKIKLNNLPDNAEVTRGGNYVSFETAIGPSLDYKINDKYTLITSIHAGPSVFLAPNSFTYTVQLGDIQYKVADEVESIHFWTNDWFRPRYGLTAVVLRGPLMFGVRHSRSRFRSPRKISVSPFLDNAGDYVLSSRSSSWRFLLGLSF